MRSVNYFILGELFGLLERIELIHGVEFSQFDPDDEKDVERIAEEFIKPTVRESTAEAQDALCLSIAYYTTVEKAPVQYMKNRCQELTLPDAESWSLFFTRIGTVLFGSEFKLRFDTDAVTERPSEQESELIFRRD
jgi:hypothetical protein